MNKRKPIVLVDEKEESKIIIQLFIENNIEHLLYPIKNFETSCCGDLPTTKVPSVIAPEGIFKDFEQIQEYIKNCKNFQNEDGSSSESIYW